MAEYLNTIIKKMCRRILECEIIISDKKINKSLPCYLKLQDKKALIGCIEYTLNINMTITKKK